MRLCDEPAAADRDDLAEADRLVEDLGTLLEAGLIVVQEHVLGPPRYSLAPVRAVGGTAGSRSAPRPRDPGGPRPRDGRRAPVSVLDPA
jgi:hypothetical protein